MQPVRTALIGCGSMARYHITRMLKLAPATQITAICEPSVAAYDSAAALFTGAGVAAPPHETDVEQLLANHELDAVFIITPHAYHFAHASTCLAAGIDVLLEKPMVMNAGEARALIDARDRSGRLLVVAFPGSLSPQVRAARRMIASGELGRILTISGVVWQNWGEITANTWRQVPELSGGGFLFDTGAHLLNTVTDLVGEPFTEVSAWLAGERTVETLGAVLARTASGTLITLNACGEGIPACDSEVKVFLERAIITSGIWGERFDIQYTNAAPAQPVPVPPSLGVWETFLAVRAGTQPNPCPPEVGLRMALLWDAIQNSAANGGRVVTIGDTA